MRKIISESPKSKEDELEIKRLQIVDRFRNASFHDLINRYDRKVSVTIEWSKFEIKIFVIVFQSNDLQQKLLEAFSKLSNPPSNSHSNSPKPISDGPEGGDTTDGGTEKEWHFYDNPLKEICTSEVNSKGPPLFALKFPELFVY